MEVNIRKEYNIEKIEKVIHKWWIYNEGKSTLKRFDDFPS